MPVHWFPTTFATSPHIYWPRAGGDDFLRTRHLMAPLSYCMPVVGTLEPKSVLQESRAKHNVELSLVDVVSYGTGLP